MEGSAADFCFRVKAEVSAAAPGIVARVSPRPVLAVARRLGLRLMKAEDGGQTVLVTGGSGFLGGWCVIELLRRGYTVRTTVRSLSREPQVRATVGSEVDPGDREDRKSVV